MGSRRRTPRQAISDRGSDRVILIGKVFRELTKKKRIAADLGVVLCKPWGIVVALSVA